MEPEFYYITADAPTVKVPLELNNEISLNLMDIIELVPPPWKKIFCSCNYLTNLVIPEGCEVLSCYMNNLTNLIIPQSCINIYCSYNKLTCLILSNKSKYVTCHTNKLPKLIIKLLESVDPIKIDLANNLQSL